MREETSAGGNPDRAERVGARRPAAYNLRVCFRAVKGGRWRVSARRPSDRVRAGSPRARFGACGPDGGRRHGRHRRHGHRPHRRRFTGRHHRCLGRRPHGHTHRGNRSGRILSFSRAPSWRVRTRVQARGIPAREPKRPGHVRIHDDRQHSDGCGSASGRSQRRWWRTRRRSTHHDDRHELR